MKHSIIILMASMLLSILCISCGDDDDDDDNLVITVDDAAEYVAASMAVATYGAVYNLDYMSEQIVELIDCNESESETRTDSETSNNGNIMVEFTISEDYSRTCSEGSEVITYTFNADQNTTSERRDSDTEILGSWTISGVESSATAFTYNGTYSRGGEWTYNLEDNHTDNVTASFVYSNVKANKDDNIIFEGNATFSLVGTSTVYDPFTYEGTIVFLADNLCIATFSTGEQYEIDLNTGDVTPI